MKKLFLIAIFALAGIFTANAQVWLGGSANGFANKSDMRITVVPEIGYNFSGTPWAVATGAEFSYDKYKTQDAHFQFALNPYVRYTITHVEKFAFFADLAGDFTISGYNNVFDYRIALQPGVAFNPTEQWTATFRLGMISYNDKGIFGPYEGFYFGFAAAVPSFGLYYNF